MDPELIGLAAPFLAVLGTVRRMLGSRPPVGRAAANTVRAGAAPLIDLAERLPGPAGILGGLSFRISTLVVATSAGLVADGAELIVGPAVRVAGLQGTATQQRPSSPTQYATPPSVELEGEVVAGSAPSSKPNGSGDVRRATPPRKANRSRDTIPTTTGTAKAPVRAKGPAQPAKARTQPTKRQASATTNRSSATPRKSVSSQSRRAPK